MTIHESQAWILLIAAISSAVVSIIAAWKANITGKKVDVLHQLTERLEENRRRNER
jgi:hypothetical protein